jgi:Ca2+/H+ antiporter
MRQHKAPTNLQPHFCSSDSKNERMPAKPLGSDFPTASKARSDDALVMAVGITVVVSIVCATVTAHLLQSTLDMFGSSQAMVGIITDAGVVFDDKNTERQLSSATMAMIRTRDIATAMSIGSAFVLFSLFWRIFKKS